MKVRDRIEALELQFRISEQWAKYWYGQAVTGVCKSRNISIGRESTSEERAARITLPMRPMADEEKTKIALQVMESHIRNMRDFSEEIMSLLSTENHNDFFQDAENEV